MENKVIEFDNNLISDYDFSVQNKHLDESFDIFQNMYRFDDDVIIAVGSKVELLKGVFVKPLENCEAKICVIQNLALKILMDSKMFDGYVVEGGQVVSVVKPEQVEDFKATFGHELNHLAAFQKEDFRGFAGFKVGEVISFGVDKTFDFLSDKLFLNDRSQEGINTVITSLGYNEEPKTYRNEVLGTFWLPYLMGFENLKKSMVLDHDQTVQFANELSGNSDWFGKLEILLCGLSHYSEELKKCDENHTKEYYNILSKKVRIKRLIPKLGVSDILVPYFSKSKNKNGVSEFFKVVENSMFKDLFSEFLYEGIARNKEAYKANEAFEFGEYKKRVQKEFEEVVSIIAEDALEISYNKLVSAEVCDKKNIFSQETSRKIIGICEYQKLSDDQKLEYEREVVEICENSGGNVGFKTGFAISREHRQLMDRIIPNKKGMRDLGMFEYVAEKNGYVLKDLEISSKFGNMILSVEKANNIDEESCNEVFRSFADGFIKRDTEKPFGGF